MSSDFDDFGGFISSSTSAQPAVRAPLPSQQQSQQQASLISFDEEPTDIFDPVQRQTPMTTSSTATSKRNSTTFMNPVMVNDAAIARRLQQEEADAEIAKKFAQEEEDAELAKRMTAEESAKSPALSTDAALDTPRKRKGNPSVQEFQPFLRDYALMMELRLVKKCEHLAGMYLMPSRATMQVWDGIYFPHHGKYQYGVFRFKINMPDDFPVSRPTVRFIGSVYHPQIGTDGVFETVRQLPTWEAGKNHVWQIALLIKQCFSRIDHRQPLNKAAANLFVTDEPMYDAEVAACVKESLDSKWEVPDENCRIKFTKLSDETFNKVLECMKTKAYSQIPMPVETSGSNSSFATIRSSIASGLRMFFEG